MEKAFAWIQTYSFGMTVNHSTTETISFGLLIRYCFVSILFSYSNANAAVQTFSNNFPEDVLKLETDSFFPNA